MQNVMIDAYIIHEKQSVCHFHVDRGMICVSLANETGRSYAYRRRDSSPGHHVMSCRFHIMILPVHDVGRSVFVLIQVFTIET